MRCWSLVLTSILCACASGGHVTTMDSFSEVPIGASMAEVREFVGEPVSEKKLSDGSIEYVYIERFKVGDRNFVLRRYYLVMKDGVVVSKRVDEPTPAPYRPSGNSYHLQTTKNVDMDSSF